MKNKLTYVFLIYILSTSLYAGGISDDPVLTKVMINQLEKRLTEGDDPLIFEGQAWIGKDLNKFVIKADVEQVNGAIEELELQALYGKAIAPFWDLQLGIRQDIKPGPVKSWLAVGFQGLAPYWFEIDTTLFIGESNQIGLRFIAEYELLFTQRLILTPEIEVNFHSKNDASSGIGSGLSNSRLGLRLRYEIKREIAPYIGINVDRKYGATATMATGKVSDTQVVIGIRSWF